MSEAPLNVQEDLLKPSHPFKEAWAMFRGNHAAMFGLAVLLIVVFAGVFGPIIFQGDPFDMVWAPFSPPGEEGYLLGKPGRLPVARGLDHHRHHRRLWRDGRWPYLQSLPAGRPVLGAASGVDRRCAA